MKVLLIAYNNDSFIHWFPQGLAYIASVLVGEGYSVTIYNQDKHHYPDEHLTDYIDRNSFDVVGFGVIAGYYEYRKLLSISEAVHRSKNRPFYIIGGHGPSPEPCYFLKKTGADAAVLGEGEETIKELLGTVAAKRSISHIPGIAFPEGDKIVVNERRSLIQQIDTIPFPAYDLFPIEYYRLLRFGHAGPSDFIMPLLSGRGCSFTCNFCYRMDKGLRTRSSESIIEEISFLKRNYGITYIMFSDELLMVSEKRTIDLCEAMIKANLGIRWFCNGRLNYATPVVLKAMKKAGCNFINYGIEAMDDQVLKNMNKCLTTQQIVKGIEATLKEGISPGFNIIFGNIGESKETLERGVEFLLKYDNGTEMRTIRPVTPYPGSPLYYHAIEKGLLRDCEDFYENKHVNSDLLAVNFTGMSDDEFHRALLEANRRLIENYFHKKMHATIKQAEELYLKKDAGFRGFRRI